MNKIPPFHIGQEIIALGNHEQGLFKENDEFTVTGIERGCCSWEVTIGIKIDRDIALCLLCHETAIINGEHPFLASRFAPKVYLQAKQTSFKEIIKSIVSYDN